MNLKKKKKNQENSPSRHFNSNSLVQEILSLEVWKTAEITSDCYFQMKNKDMIWELH